jgi:hypothetical protein
MEARRPESWQHMHKNRRPDLYASAGHFACRSAVCAIQLANL